jgi:hypothetical protein
VATQDLVIDQGADFGLTLTLTQPLVVRSPAAVGATSIQIEPVVGSLPSGSTITLRSGGVLYRVTLSATLTSMSPTLPVIALTEAIPIGSKGIGPPLNLTGFTGRSQLRIGYGADSAVDFEVAIAEPSTLGQISLSMSSTVTAALTPNLKSAYKISYKAEDLALDPYVWDLELVDEDARVRRVVGGRVLVTPEVTR